MKIPRKIWVCNALDTEDYDRPDGMGSCLEFWKREQDKTLFPADPDICRVRHNNGIPSSPIVGAHVIGFMEGKPHVYIVPMHDSCNLKKQSLEPFRVLRSDLVRVPNLDERAILNMKSNKLQIAKMQKFVQNGIVKRFRRLSGIG